MTKLQLFLLLHRNTSLCERRNPMYEQNQYARLLAYIGVAFTAIYLIVMGTLLGSAAVDDKYYTGIFALLPVFLLLDFFVRFCLRQVPLLTLRPYLLLPVSKKDVVDCFLLSEIIDKIALVWLFFLLPYYFICVCGGMSVGQAVLAISLCEIVFVANGQWQLLVRTLVHKSLLWWLLPIGVYLALFLPFVVWSKDGFFEVLEFYGDHGYSFLASCLYLLALVGLFSLNRFVYLRLSGEEIALTQEKEIVGGMSALSALSRFGIIGEYLKMEFKSAFRNKTVRKLYLGGIVLIVLLTGMTAYTEVYDGFFSTNMWCLYGFIYFGGVNLAKVMGVEGNYIDLLLVYKESVYQLLRAKYYFFCSVLVIPSLILLPAVVEGKYSLLMYLAYMFTAAGPLYCLLFQLAVYNKQTLPLNERLTGKGSLNNSLQMVISLVVFIAPVGMVMLLTTLLGTTSAYMVMIVIGLLFVVAHPWWLSNVYRRMMANKYELLDGFHSTR